jgi:tRNA (mo5U34)-methyltransferase
VQSLGWFHTIDLGDGLVTPGSEDVEFEEWRKEAIPKDLRDKTVLDVGANDGLYSFTCEERGAIRILAVESFQDTRCRETFPLAQRLRHSKVELKEMDVCDVDRLGEKFDVVLFMEVYYHIEQPLLAFQKLRHVTKELLMIEGYYFEDPRPVMYLFEPYELSPRDASNVWGASIECLKRMCKRAGFADVTVHSRKASRAILFARPNRAH